MVFPRGERTLSGREARRSKGGGAIFKQHRPAEERVRRLEGSGPRPHAAFQALSADRMQPHLQRMNERATEFGKTNPMSRPAQPVELAGAFVFLASEESRYVNGEVLGVTGGKPLA
jgi:NAD(P)-dependent dehydrogenase (short-subunit alcohol dehydrogenase family)